MIKNFIEKIFKDLFAIDFVFIISIVTSLIYGLVFVQEKYDAAVVNQNKLYSQLNTQFLMFGHIDGIRFDQDNESEEITFIESKSVLLKIEKEKDNKILIISCEKSKLPK